MVLKIKRSRHHFIYCPFLPSRDPTMSKPKAKRVFYVRHVYHAIFAETLAARADVSLQKVENDATEDVATATISSAHAYQVGASRDELQVRFHVSADLLARAPNLLIASSSGAGFDPIDVDACTAAGVIVLNQSGGNARSVAEHAVGLLLSLAKRISEADHALRRGAVTNRNTLIGTEVFGKTIGIVGLGHAGGAMARLCGGALGLKVLAFDPYLETAVMAERGAEKVNFDDLLRRSNFISVHCPLNTETRQLFGAREFSLMRNGTFFITTARGFIHDEAALTEAIASKHLGGAGLDVWAQEPPAASHPLMRFDNVIVSPHTAGVTHEARYRMGLIAAEQLLAALDGRVPPRLINPEAWPKYAARFEAAFGFAPDALL